MNEDLQENLQEEEVNEDLEENEEIDYSSLLSDINENLNTLNSEVLVLQEQQNDLIDAQNGLLNNTWYVVYFLFGFFVFGALVLVIKFFKGFF